MAVVIGFAALELLQAMQLTNGLIGIRTARAAALKASRGVVRAEPA
jgi:hypothetical protein